MATWVGKITLTCPTGHTVRKFSGSPDEILRRVTHYTAPAGCETKKIEIVKRGVGAGLPDKLWHGAKSARRARWAPDLGADSHLFTNALRHVSSFGGARRRKRKKARR